MAVPAPLTDDFASVDTTGNVLKGGGYGRGLCRFAAQAAGQPEVAAALTIAASLIGGIEALGMPADRLGFRRRHMEPHRRVERRRDHFRPRRDGLVRVVLGGLYRGLSPQTRSPHTRSHHAIVRLIGALVAVLLLTRPAAADPLGHDPVKVVADARLTVVTPAGRGEVPIYLSADWSQPLPNITRAVIVVHGVGRDAAGYLRGAEAARAAAGPEGQNTLLVVPQFLADIDVATFHLPAAVLHWSTESWLEGEPAHGPAPLSSFDVFDAVLGRLADRTLLPNLVHVVLAGHSAGGQVVQRYTIVGRGEAALAARGVTLRYVVANPSTYLYFSDDRPMPVDRATCPGFDRWRYGLAGAPPYVGDTGGVGDTAGIEARFAARHVDYLLGTADTDPHHPALNTSCGAEAEGPHRFARGMVYFIYLQARHPGTLAQRIALVPGVGHSGAAMFGSACGLAALFDRPGCPGL